ncbi:type VII secretion system-associated protein [Saccharopolyspora sp. NPDC002686]|uniref:type VII secretion system-associated protein n=1 Tax=Saccharopolyspora sp. NPDC002686 TaxID=3154541 RepID=UPI003319682E
MTLIVDPGYESEDGQVPEVAIVGGWYIDPEGDVSHFRSNRAYLPSSPELPTDPVDAALRLVMRGESDADQFVAMLPEATFCIGLDERGSAIVTRDPDGQQTVLVVTALAHAHRLTVPAWTEITARQLADLLPVEGVDILFNPGAPASVRLGADELRKAIGSGN